MADEQDKFSRLDAPPPSLFTNEQERNFTKQIVDEVIERVLPQRILYYAIDTEITQFHSLYGEAINKSFLPPVAVGCKVEWEGKETESTSFGVEQKTSIMIYFQKVRIAEDQNLFVRVGDFVRYGQDYYEIVSLSEPRELFAETNHKFEVVVKAIKARRGLFNAQ
jgi:hypothetical protein